MKKLSKSMVGLAALLVVVAATMGCVDKANGGGWFIDERTNDKCTFGFNAQYKDNPGAVANEKQYTGQFQFKDHGPDGIKFHIEEMTYVTTWGDDWVCFAGYDKDEKLVIVCVVDKGEPGWDVGDSIAIWYDVPGMMGLPIWEPTWSGDLGGGNIQTHEAK